MDQPDNFDALEQQSQDLKEARAANQELAQAMSASSFQGKNDNVIEFQLGSDDLLTSIEHFLKGDYVAVDAEGNQYYKKQDNDDLVLLNEYGVNSVLQILSNYVNKNTFLSYYKEERINMIMADLGKQLTIFIYCNYEKMGLTTEFKKSRYPMLVVNILHAVESGYRRAIGGMERSGINETKILTQSIVGNGEQKQPKKSIFNPGRYFG